MIDHPVILFDGVCNLCNGFVQFIIKRDAKAKFRFAALQSDFAKEELQKRNINPNIINTVIFLDKELTYTQSTAALEIAKTLGKGWQLFYPLIFLPTFFRDYLYKIVAKNRYKWFGQKDSCMVPTPELKSRFLDSSKLSL
jgi:predicted DCC family thiol-disulfide oxidoreductase YuxK